MPCTGPLPDDLTKPATGKQEFALPLGCPPHPAVRHHPFSLPYVFVHESTLDITISANIIHAPHPFSCHCYKSLRTNIRPLLLSTRALTSKRMNVCVVSRKKWHGKCRARYYWASRPLSQAHPPNYSVTHLRSDRLGLYNPSPRIQKIPCQFIGFVFSTAVRINSVIATRERILSLSSLGVRYSPQFRCH
jgi:hypothetical protein